MENLHGLVRIHGGRDLGDNAQVSVDEFAQAAVIVHCTRSAAASHIQFKSRNAESVLHVHQHQPGFGLVSGSRLKSVLKRPVPCLSCAFFVWHTPDLVQFTQSRKNRELAECCS